MASKSNVATKTLLTCDEFEKLAPTLGKSELIDGEVVELASAGQPQGHITAKFAGKLITFVEERNLGWVMTNETGIHVSRKRRRTRGENVVFISYKRLPEGTLPKGFMTVPPELIVEVFGEEDTWGDMDDKIKDYHDFGVDMVWVADPETHTLQVYPRGGKKSVLDAKSEIDGGKILPGFKMKVAKFFRK